jgi:3-oxoacyl-[acyl-carrier protein] reductase
MKKILILGGSSDIGVNLIKKLIKKNFFIYAHYSKNSKKLKKIKNIKIKTICLDFNQINSKNINAFLKKKFQFNYDIIINLVGYVDKKGFENTSLDTMLNSIKNNALIPMLIIKKNSKYMLSKLSGRILNCSSIGVKFGGGISSFNYSLSKHCLEFIPNIYKQWAKKNVLINNIRIGVTDTKIHKKIKNKKEIRERIKLIPLGRIAKVDEISNFILSLIDEKNSYTTNQTFSISGGE